ncbi:MAG: DUF3592 domain-containing protein [Victivallaceae bacterium]|nr:DUF3592 domain-containing protein [Victivallaceae bacterium]
MRVNSNISSNPETLGGKLILTVFFSVFFFAGLFFLVFMTMEFYNSCTPYFWDETPCTITSSKVIEPANPSSEPKFEVQYKYRYKNKSYTCGNFSGKGNFSQNARRRQHKYPKGSKAKCYVNPSNPHYAVIYRKIQWFLLGFSILPLIFVAIGAGLIYLTWKKTIPEKKYGAAAVKNTAEKGRKVFLPLFFSLFFLAGSGFGWMLVGRPLLKIQASENWPKVPCRIVFSRVKVSRSDKSTSYRVDITFKYEFKGIEYVGGAYDFMAGSDSNCQSKHQVVTLYPPGKKTYCYVNPEDPTEAVISREYNASWWLAAIPAVFMLVGAGGVIGALMKKKKKHVYSPAVEESVPDFVAPTGETVLKIKSSTLRNFIGAVFVALLWNGIVSLFIGVAVKNWKTGNIEWFLIIFMIPFALIGLALIGAVIYCFVALFNSRVTVTISNPRPQPGEKLTLGWKVINAASVDKLEIFLKGEESATYQTHGKNNSAQTRKSTFELLKLLDTENREAIHIGRTQFTVPRETMHSFDGEHNKIQWQIVLHGVIKRRPDINCEYPITVMPFTREALHKLLRSAENGGENG